MTQEENAQSSLLDSLYCEEEELGEFEEGSEKINFNGGNMSHFPHLLTEQDFFWEDEELDSLFCKENEVFLDGTCFSLSLQARTDAVERILKVKFFYGFSALTAILAVNYLDRFLCSIHFQKEKPWMIQLAAVTCLSLAAKVEETHVPLLLDLQIEDTRYMFDSKTIQRMELLVLSALNWRMNSVTPISFLDYIIRRLGLKSNIHWEFLWRCENLLLSLVADSRFVRYLPSVLATATMLHVIHQVEPCNAIHYENQLLEVLKINKDRVNDCYEMISDTSKSCLHGQNNSQKRKNCQVPSSPSGVMDEFFNSDRSNDSWGTVGSCISSTHQPFLKKIRVHEQRMKLPSLKQDFCG
ncbi:cyclin-D3-1-like [Olea europaea subsp. europaea]|uniref:Cyclin-D3-1-like n=1 Tax=Olea europaea subsp. europaea TaxID=158383 RepID=A0A8S0SJ69_OLEEU|nr:cyclin-D3-1-like [Olea europaea subsp. europaea]